MFLCFKLETIVSSALIHSTLLSSWLYFQQRKSPEFWTTKWSKEGAWFHSFGIFSYNLQGYLNAKLYHVWFVVWWIDLFFYVWKVIDSLLFKITNKESIFLRWFIFSSIFRQNLANFIFLCLRPHENMYYQVTEYPDIFY